MIHQQGHGACAAALGKLGGRTHAHTLMLRTHEVLQASNQPQPRTRLSDQLHQQQLKPGVRVIQQLERGVDAPIGRDCRQHTEEMVR